MARTKPDEAETSYLIGYARVSTADQSLEAQLDALRRFGVKEENTYTDNLSAVSARRRGWELCKKALRPGDTLVVYSLSRLGRSVPHLLEINDWLLREGVALKSLTEPIDTRTADGKLLFTVRAAFAQFERDITIERTKAGLEARKTAGFKLGRPSSLSDKVKAAILKDLGKPELTRSAIAKKHGTSPQVIKYHFPKPRHAYVIEAAKARK